MHQQHTATIDARDEFETAEFEVIQGVLAHLVAGVTGWDIRSRHEVPPATIAAALRDIADRLEATEGREGPPTIH